jgi:hypothetical protein
VSDFLYRGRRLDGLLLLSSLRGIFCYYWTTPAITTAAKGFLTEYACGRSYNNLTTPNAEAWSTDLRSHFSLPPNLCRATSGRLLRDISPHQSSHGSNHYPHHLHAVSCPIPHPSRSPHVLCIWLRYYWRRGLSHFITGLLAVVLCPECWLPFRPLATDDRRCRGYLQYAAREGRPELSPPAWRDYVCHIDI